jgi:hypothetical protein
MLSKKPAGPQAASVKYDLLTAIGTFALSQGKGRQALCLRFMTLLTARYNWARNELSVGQREIARMWAVDERTVKREMAKLRTLGWLVVKRQGVRGRVTLYGIDLDRITQETQPVWEAVGPDFKSRMEGPSETNHAKIIPLEAATAIAPPSDEDQTEWGRARRILFAQDAALFSNWIAGLQRRDCNDGRLTLVAPSKFHAHYVATHLMARFLEATRASDRSVQEISIVA